MRQWETKATRHNHLGRDTATKRLDLLPDVAEESVAGPATEQHDGVHRYTVEIHCHGRRGAKGVESDALWVEAQAFEIHARDETSEHPQGGRGVKIAGTSVVALEFVKKSDSEAPIASSRRTTAAPTTTGQ